MIDLSGNAWLLAQPESDMIDEILSIEQAKQVLPSKQVRGWLNPLQEIVICESNWNR